MTRRLTTDDRREELLAAGLQIFGDQPYEAVTLDGIAAAAGISKGLLYHYFKGKRAFYLAVLEHVSDGLLDATAPPDAAPWDAIDHTLRAFLAYIRVNWRLYLALLRGGAGVEPVAVAVVERVRETEVQRIREALELDAAADLALYGFIGFAEAIGARFITESLDEDAVIALLTDTLGALVARHALT